MRVATVYWHGDKNPTEFVIKGFRGDGSRMVMETAAGEVILPDGSYQHIEVEYRESTD